MNIKNLKRRLLRLKNLRDDLLLKHDGRELEYTYWGGYELGYIKGKINEIEGVIDCYNEKTLKDLVFRNYSTENHINYSVNTLIGVYTIELYHDKFELTFEKHYLASKITYSLFDHVEDAISFAREKHKENVTEFMALVIKELYK